ncbi:hypothetical protein [Streptomyces goshikiensis]|uniref:hypothetical protein n=1 Tax=Streptomyces goshikiensis TaxID=1942 RepID=UPI0036BC639F
MEPMKGCSRGEQHSHRAHVPDSPGWSEEQKETVDRMGAENRQLLIDVVDHPHWKSVPTDTLVASRMQLKRQGRPTEAPETAEAA